MTAEKMKNVPNILTVIRIITIPVFMLLMIFPFMPDLYTRLVGAALFGAIAYTDALDGKIARKYNIVSDFGKFLDPIADKLLVLGSMLSLIAYMGAGAGRLNLFGILTLFAIYIILMREFAVTSMRMLAKNASGKVEGAQMAGKVKTVFQIVFVLSALLEPVLWSIIGKIAGMTVAIGLPITYISLAVMLFMTVYSGIVYYRSYGISFN